MANFQRLTPVEPRGTAAPHFVSRAETVAAARHYLGKGPLAINPPRGIPISLRSFYCGGLILAVAEDLRLIDVDGRPFKRSDANDATYQSGAALGDSIRKRLVFRLAQRESYDLTRDFTRLCLLLEPGDVVNVRIPTPIGFSSHLGILSEIHGEPSLIHLYPDDDGVYGSAQGLQVVERRFDARWLSRIAEVFSFPGVN